MPTPVLAVGALNWFFASSVVFAAFRVMGGLGFGLYSYVGVSNFETYIYNKLSNIFTLIPDEAIQIIGILRLDQALSIMFSAIVILIGLKTTKWVVGKG